MDPKRRRHQKLLIAIHQNMNHSPESSEWESFNTALGSFLEPGIISENTTIPKKLDALTTHGLLNPGEYENLKVIFHDAGNIRILKLVEDAEREIAEMSAGGSGDQGTGQTSGTSSGTTDCRARDTKIEKGKQIHQELLTHLNEEIGGDRLTPMKTISKAFIGANKVDSCTNFLQLAEALEDKGYISPGDYDFLTKDIFKPSGYANRTVLELIDQAAKNIKKLDEVDDQPDKAAKHKRKLDEVDDQPDKAAKRIKMFDEVDDQTTSEVQSSESPPSSKKVTGHPSRHAIQDESTVSDSRSEAVAALPEVFRVLQSCLMEYYKNLITMPTGVGNIFDQVDLDTIYAEPCLVQVDHTAGTKEKAKESEKIISLNDVFLENPSACRQIYVSGDAGMGKTSLCKRIIKDWCSVHSQGQLTDSPGQISTLKQFQFLFFISLRNAGEQYGIKEMIVSQLLPHIKQDNYPNNKTGECLDKVLKLYSERCLIVLDGLDEWKGPGKSKYPSVSDGVPGRILLLKYTILTTTRPWKLEALRLKNTEIDCQIEVRGVESIGDFGRKLVLAHNKMENEQKQYKDFEDKLHQAGLQKMGETPILLKQLICLWLNDQPFGKSKTGVYTHMVELLFKLAEKREDVTEFDLQKTPSEVEAEESPIWFKNMERCEKYKCLILSIGKLAFETMFSSEKETQLVFESSEAQKNDLNKNYVDVCLNVGIIPDKTWERKSLSFLHKTLHEYFAALYLSLFGKGVSDIKTRFGSKCKSLDSVFDMEDMFLFLGGMCPSLMEDVSTCLVTAINNDTKVEEARLQLDHDRLFQNPLCRVQSMILACCKESSDNDMGSLYLPVPDVVMPSIGLSHESCRTLGLCVQKYPSELRSFQWTTGTSISAIEEIISVKHLDGACLEGSESDTYYMDFSIYNNLSHLVCSRSPPSISPPSISHTCYLSWKVIEQQLVSLHLSYVSSKSVLSTIRQATRLQALKLWSVQCSKSAADGQDIFSLDLAGHNDLATVCIKDIPAGRVTLNSSIRVIKVEQIDTLSHDGMCSLMSSISNAQSLVHIALDSVKCGDHITGEGCQYEIDLSGHSGLRMLDVKDMSLGSVTLSPSISEITVRNSHTLSHDGMCSLMSSISNAHSLLNITLDSVKCGDHITGEGCQYEIDLSGHSGLETLYVRDISSESVPLSLAIRAITMTNIHTLSHSGMCSLMSSISNAHSLEHITLSSVKCRDHATGKGCQYEIDLSRHSGLWHLDVEDISLESVTLSPSIREITMRNIHTLSHDGMCSLMSSLSNTHSLQDITLVSVNCRDHVNGIGCQYETDLSGHSELEILYLEDISPESVTLSPSIRLIIMRNIHTLSHDSMCSLMSSIPNAHSLLKIILDSVKCRDHITGERCQYEIDLSGHSEVLYLGVEDISPESVTLSPSINSILMRNIHTLSHDGMCSLMSSISNAHFLLDITLDSVKCRDHITGEGCQYEIDLSEHSLLRELDVTDISVTLSPSIRKITMRKIHTLSHGGMCSLMSSISNAHTLKFISLDSVKCGDHITGEGCQYEIDLAGHSELDMLDLGDISPESVTLSPAIRTIILRNIHTLSHGGMYSLVSSISSTHSLEEVTLDSVKCGDHITGERCQYEIDLSAHSGLKKIVARDISPESLTLSPATRVIVMTNIHTLSHDSMCSLMSSISSISNVPPHVCRYLKSIRCIDYVRGDQCGNEIELETNLSDEEIIKLGILDD